MAVRPPTRPAGQVSPAAQGSSTVTALRALLAPVVAEAGVVLEDVSLTRAGHHQIVTVLVDGENEGIDLDTVAGVSRLVSEALDAKAQRLLPGAYTLEVSTPGVDRPLSEARHWTRNIGRLVSLTHAGTLVTGRIIGVDADEVRLDVPGPKGRPGREITVALAEVSTAVVQVELTRVAAHDEDSGETL